MSTLKYELGEEKEFYGIKMRRVVALVAIASKGVNPGDVGGWVESEQNLSQVSDEAWVSGEAQVSGKAQVSGEAQVSETRDLLVIGPIGSRNDYLTIALDYAAVGCFCGNWTDFVAKVSATHGTSQNASEYLAAIEFAKTRFGKFIKVSP